MIIALAQINPTVGALEENTSRIKSCARKAGKENASLVIFPELCLTGYPPRDLLLSNAFLDKTEQIIKDELGPITRGGAPALLLGAPYRKKDILYNSALLLAAGSVQAAHMKSLLPNYDIFDEKRYFKPASRRKVEQLAGLEAAVTICEDIWNDEDFFPDPRYDFNPLDDLHAQGFRVIINLSASPFHRGKQVLRENLAGFLAAKYDAGIIYVNQIGGNDELIFDGNSLVFNRQGQLIRRGASFAEDLVLLESSELLEPASKKLPPPGEDIGSIYEALKLGLKDYLEKTGFQKAVVGLSGGMDSAVTAALAAEALEPGNVLGVLMPSIYSSGHSMEDAEKLAQNLGIEQRVIPINQPFDSFLKMLTADGKPRQDLAEENLQARLRGIILMYISNREGYLPLTTGNKSELAVGYCTLYGDMAGGLAPLADVTKTMLYELAEHINTLRGKEIIPYRTITKPPSAELRPNQKDEDSLPPYRELDAILSLYLDKNLDPQEIIDQGYRAGTVYRITAMVDDSEFKRRQAAPGLRVTSKAFGAGRKMPIAKGRHR